MVKPGKIEDAMGQMGLCAVSNPRTDSLPPSNGTATEVHASLSSLLASNCAIDPEELVRKLCSIINENYELKETIAQNNLAIKHQLGLLERWNLQIELHQNQHKQALSDANKHMNSLQQENSLLRATLASSKGSSSESSKFSEFDEAIKSLNGRLEVTEEHLDKLKSEKEELFSQKTKLEGDLTMVKCSLSSSRGEVERLQAQRIEMLSSINDLRDALQRERHKVVNPSIPREDNTQRMPPDFEDSSINSLMQDLKAAKSQIVLLEAEIKRTRDESSIYRKQLEEDASGTGMASALNLISENEQRRLKDANALLKEEIETLESALAEERSKTNEERMTLSRLQNEIARLKRDLQEAKEHSERSEYTDQYYQAKIKSIHEQHDEVTAKLVSYEELLGAKNDEIARLKKETGRAKAQLSEFKSEGDTIAVLRAQVEVYQGDFRAEREARESLATEREKLRDEVRHLHARNTQLMDELEAYQRGLYAQGMTSRGGSAEPHSGVKDTSYQAQQQQSFPWERFSASPEKRDEHAKKDEAPEVDENLLYCPKCNKSFTELRPLEEHVNRCLDED